MSKILTEAEVKLLADTWSCFTSEPGIDYEQLAALAGHSNSKSTRNAVARIRKKLDLPNVSASKAASPATPMAARSAGKGAGNKRKAAVHDDDEEEDDEEKHEKSSTPEAKTKRMPKKRRTPAAKKAKQSSADSDEDKNGDAAAAAAAAAASPVPTPSPTPTPKPVKKTGVAKNGKTKKAIFPNLKETGTADQAISGDSDKDTTAQVKVEDQETDVKEGSPKEISVDPLGD